MIYSAVIEKWNKHCKKINTNHLIVLCEIGEDYKSFCEDLEKLIKSKNNRDLVKKAYRVMRGKFSIGAGKYKSFIEKHKQAIEIMNKYYCLSDLTVLSYDTRGKRRKGLTEDYIYQYIQEHKEDIETIKSIALKIKKLGFERIKFNENLDFTKLEFQLDNLHEGDFAFLENIEIKPTDLQSIIKYKTKGSHYCIYLGSSGGEKDKEVSKYWRSIELNSLIFDPSKLPNEITTESTIGVIQKLSSEKKEQKV